MVLQVRASVSVRRGDGRDAQDKAEKVQLSAEGDPDADLTISQSRRPKTL